MQACHTALCVTGPTLSVFLKPWKPKPTFGFTLQARQYARSALSSFGVSVSLTGWVRQAIAMCLMAAMETVRCRRAALLELVFTCIS